MTNRIRSEVERTIENMRVNGSRFKVGTNFGSSIGVSIVIGVRGEREEILGQNLKDKVIRIADVRIMKGI